MIVVVKPADRHLQIPLIRDYQKLRKRTFADTLKWSVKLTGDEEVDEFDGHPHILVLDTEDGHTVQGGLRLMPMHQPNLLNTTFGRLLPSAEDFRSPNIWEVTRFCVDESHSAEKTPTGASAVSLRISYQSLLVTRQMGGTHHIAVVEERTLNLIRLFGGRIEVLGRSGMEGGADIVCAIWPIDDAFIERMQWIERRLHPASASEAALVR